MGFNKDWRERARNLNSKLKTTNLEHEINAKSAPKALFAHSIDPVH